MPPCEKSTSFGRRTAAPAPAGEGQEGRLSERRQLDFLRPMVADAIELWMSSPAQQHPQLLSDIRGMQEKITKLKLRYADLAYRPSKYGWVDSWRPPVAPTPSMPEGQAAG